MHQTPRDSVMERLGHSTMQTAMRYQHATRPRQRALADALDVVVAASLADPNPRHLEVRYG